MLVATVVTIVALGVYLMFRSETAWICILALYSL